jgi:Na+-translocating ferredoxin:NAD+ oxidoreductase RnfG subunit
LSEVHEKISDLMKTKTKEDISIEMVDKLHALFLKLIKAKYEYDVLEENKTYDEVKSGLSNTKEENNSSEIKDNGKVIDIFTKLINDM